MAQTYHADIYITLKESVLDPQGQVVQNALENLSFAGIGNVRIGKWIQLTLEAEDEKAAKETAHKACEKLLVNKVIESYHLSIKPT